LAAYLTKDEAVHLAGRLGIHFTGTECLDEHRKVLKERWKDIECFMPSEMLKENESKSLEEKEERNDKGETTLKKQVTGKNVGK
jgi:hypothetical protein